MQETLIKWLMNHIRNEDRNYATTVREFGQG
jgi:hemerythrin